MVDLFKVYAPENFNRNEFIEILFSGQLTSGKLVSEFENQIGKYIGNPLVLVTANQNFASLITLALLDLKDGDEVIASPMACLASNQPVINFRAKLVWADIDPSTGSLNPDDVRVKITKKTKAIIHYHWCGYPGYIDEINQIGKEYGVKVIDDAIESFASKYKGKCMGNVGTDFTTFSFQTVRLPNSIDGGCIAFQSNEMYEKAKRIRDFGINRLTFRDELGEISNTSDISHIGYNAILNELNAAVGLSTLSQIDDLLSIQKRNAILWDESAAIEGKRLNVRTEIEPNYWVYSFLSQNQRVDLLKLRSKNIYASKVHLRNDFYSVFGGLNDKLFGVNEFANSQLAVPSGWWVNSNDIKNVQDINIY